MITKIRHTYICADEKVKECITDHNQAMWDIIHLIKPGASGDLNYYLEHWLPERLIELRIKSDAWDNMKEMLKLSRGST